MEKVFVPYVDNEPALVEVNGHRVLIVTSDFDTLLEDLEVFGGDEIRELDLPDSDEDQTETLAELVAEYHGGFVIAPPGMPASMMIEALADQLPWVH